MSWVSGIVGTVRRIVETVQQATLEADIRAAETAVQTAATNYRNNGTDTNQQALIGALDNFLILVAYDLRKVGATDPAAIDAEIARIKTQYQGTQTEKDVFFPMLDELGTQIKVETPEQRDLQIEIHDALGDVQTTQAEAEQAGARLQGFGRGASGPVRIAEARSEAQDDFEEKQGAYSTAVATLIGLELEYELTKLPPAGPNGTHTAEQWTQAGDAVRTRYGASGEFATFIDRLAVSKGGAEEVQGWLDKITTNPGSLDLTPAEEELARTDPVSLAFLKAAGVTLNPDDPSLSPEMKKVAEEDPVIFGFLQLSGAKIWTDGTPPEDAQPMPLSNGEYLYITIGRDAKPLPVTPEMIQQFEAAGPTTLATMLIPELGLDENPIFGRLAMGADIVRSDYVATRMNELMGGANPDVEGAIKLLGTHLPQFVSPDMRAATWDSAGRPKLEPVLRDEFGQFKVEEDEFIAWFFTQIGEHMNKRLDGAPPEVASLVIDLAMGRVNAVGAATPDADEYFVGDNNIFLGGFSHAVQLADQLPGASPTAEEPGVHAQKVAGWMFDSPDFVLLVSYTPGMLWGDIKETGNTYLADALVYKAMSREGEKESGLAYDLEYSVNRGKEERGNDILERINKQSYLNFMEDPAEVLEPYFDGFLGDSRIGNQITATNDTELRNIIGKTLGLTPANTEAAKNLDYSVEWYAHGTAEWNVIMTTFGLIEKEGGDDPTLKALPIQYVSEKHGVNRGALFIVIKPDGDDVVIDGTAAMNAVSTNGGARVDPGDFHSSWKFDDFKTFQEDNYYDDGGTIYMPRDFTLTDANGDGHADYEDQDAAITTFGERAKMGVGLVGAGLMFVPLPGAQGVGLALLGVSAAMSIEQLKTMKEQGQSPSWSNPAARAEYMNLIGTAAVFGRIGMLSLGAKANAAGWIKTTSFLDGGQKFAGMVATFTGFNQTVSQAQYLATNWGSLTGGQRAHGMLMLASGIAQVGFGARDLSPRLGYRFRLNPVAAPRGPSWRMQQSINQRANQVWEQAGSPPGQLPTYRTQAWQDIRDSAITQRADDLWTQAGNSQASRQPFINQARQEFDTNVVNRTDSMWQAAGQPQGQRSAYRDSAEYAVFEGAVLPPMSYPQRFRSWATNLPTRAGEYVQEFHTDWANRHGGSNPPTVRDYFQKIRTDWGNRRANPSPTYGQGWKDFLTQSRTIFKWVGSGYLIVNGTGVALESIYYFGLQERRTGPAITDAEDEMRDFLADPDQYLDDNYENAFFGVGVGDWGYNLSGHLLSFTKPDGTQVYFRRVPEGLFNAYKAALEEKGIDTSRGIFLDKTILLNESPGFNPEDAKPLDRHFTRAETAYDSEIGESAYQLWVDAGRPTGNATSAHWLQVEADFNTAVSEAAYDVWATAGKPTGGANSIWSEAVSAYQPQIDEQARQLWVAAGGPGSGPSTTHVEQAENEYKDEVGKRAYELWVDGDRQQGGALRQHWTAAEQTFETDRAKPAFDLWLGSGKPSGDDNVPWTTAYNDQATALWDADDRPYDISVELREPWREDPLQDSFMGDADGALWSGRWRGSLGIGPVEGWRPHLDIETTFNYRYNQPNVSTIRTGLPSPTQGWGVGLRQQDTTIWSQLRFNAGAVNHNRLRVYDLTTGSTGNEWAVMDGRVYLALGNRNRVRVDYAGKGTGSSSSWAHDKTYLRIRETGFMELGLGIDLVKYAYGDENFSFNGYYELQLYAPDLRGQWNFAGDGAYTRGMQPMPPFFEIDPALQISWTEPPRIAELPGLSGEQR